MSLLTSLMKAGTQFQQAMEKRPSQAPSGNGEGAKTPGQRHETVTASESGSKTDDRFTLSERATQDPGRSKSATLQMTEYRQTIGQDLAFVRETLRHKLAEYQLNPASRLEVEKNEQGDIQLGGGLPADIKNRIEQDLNNSKPFREAFSRLSASEPTLHFMDNALKLNQAYGVNNSLLDAMVSEKQEFNGLQDLIHRYDSLRRSTAASNTDAFSQARSYAFNLNTQA
ncbi:hypothetical protein [Marinobacter sp. CHS3-4]|uniref:hypothetical protein n=1 Tax=Marinobacter sp. CHS3-4 TaxID=3045174 RepID=UPI0024B50163|nr:hypothetical protein [Marinobacter sp. CHS3-4]MDI9245120.1 hypothetical protein [Marinobacter sp. CHS3-4]